MSPPQRYSFVNARPQTKAEKRQTRTAIRSHIGKWTQEKQQKIENSTSSGGDKNSPPESSRAVSPPPAPTDQTRLRPPERLGSVWSDGPDSTSSDNPSDRESTEDEVRDFSELTVTAPPHLRRAFSAGSITHSNSAIQVLGSGTLDPFRTYPSEFPSTLVSQCHDYCKRSRPNSPRHPLHCETPKQELTGAYNTIALKVLWPGLTPRPAGGTDPAASKGWFPMLLNDTVALHSLLFGALSHKRLNLLKGAGDHVGLDLTSLELDMRRCEAESIALINKALRKDNFITDAMIVSVLCMAANAWDLTLDRFLNEPAPPPIFDPMLKSLQWLDVYGLLSDHPIHAAGLMQLVKLRGGLHEIRTPGLAATVFFFGVLNASKHLTPPLFPFVPLVEDAEQNQTLWSLLGTSPTELRDECVFGGLFDLGLTNEMAMVIVAMQRYGQSVQLFVDGALADLDLARFCDRRNLIQHTLLSLPPQTDLPASDAPRPIYEPARLAMLTYSLTVIFPLPPQAAPIALLVERLRSALRETNMRASWSSSHQVRRLLVWILFIGAIAARDMPDDRSWFVALLRRLTVKENRLKKYEHLKREVLNSILWLDRSCDAAGRILWTEILGPGE
ncbi:hypothetical protein A1O7_08283 [Cladophialophora yegresii CBS 114405]|uniref:Tachykinin family protein n=1 Tax=Cladophialophora yegresii CBS 114405 TaxID=1182544 RepID=W9VT95_9EURO|nr:uncharacterized protein A1O7_08283 [Cladophialophora yegresii CBS 114405]EXJ55356.1 hypothetical protein A1O7_08283 [Cladophialophora yegresii CBS 114405]